ncbi:MAG: DNA-deoxyinosine glycosylase [Holosporales bacterium]|jgi:hypoxanthine-DNA glycosylase|nr:DNA-deoxyinosine glycosylase [Holosporales bacterium]
MRLRHPFAPYGDSRSSCLILGTFPSVRSRESGFYYGHPRNRFWKVLAFLAKTSSIPQTQEEKRHFLQCYRIALWDVVQECDLQKSQDSTITNPIPVDLSQILQKAPITHIFTNGAKAHQLFRRFFSDFSDKENALPSTSPANARYNLTSLQKSWATALEVTGCDVFKRHCS